MSTKTIAGFGTCIAVVGLFLAIPGAIAQTNGAKPGETSGPAAGTPTHMGSSPTSSPATEHQGTVVRDQSQAVKPDPRSAGGSGTNEAPGGTGTGRPSAPGTEAGPAPQPSR
jgi:hypothetical protein